MTRWLSLLAPLALVSAPALAQDETVKPTIQNLAFAAGYKAMFTCSATFNAGKSVEQIADDELRHTYPVYESLFDDVGAARIDAARRTVSVTYASGMPPRLAVHRPFLGCAALPVGAKADAARHLPRIDLDAPLRDDAAPWPMGDRLPNALSIGAGRKAALDATIGQAFDGAFDGRTSAVLIVSDGQIVGERYRDGFAQDTSQRTWSVAKSIAASVIGAAVQDELIALDEPAGLDAWSRPGDPRGAITVEHLLHMASGLNSDPAGNRTDDVYLGGGLVAQHAVSAGLDAAPGTRWRYANNDTMLALRALRERIGRERSLTYPFTALFHRIGMLDTVPETDWDGDFILSSQVWTTARDLGRLGLLYLNDGVWNGERILPVGWSDYVSAPAPVQPWGKGERPEDNDADEGYRGYGAQFWRYLDYPGVPNDTYAALGNRGQFLIIVPSRNIVIVRRGYDYRGNYFDGPGFTAAVLDALAGPD
ncbi:serine hydrolase [uncultured Algimonas sp.]|uniref:serine hydrolase domain-containing protein n=1 Tax=uncultured Algimonas sp. TaxID=1547920 RepID=UPI00263306E0|nr:serine hydrolase [uncultured Algimonas sp.]